MRKLFTGLFNFNDSSLKLQSMRSAVWSLLGKGGSQFLRLVGNLILTRLLFPEAFGLMATANITVTMVYLFSDTGIRTAIIQNPQGATPSFVNTSWIVNILRGAVLWLLMLVLARPLADFYGLPMLRDLLLIISFCPLINGFENPALPLLVKTFRVEKEIRLEIQAQLMSLVLTILLVTLIDSVLALAIGVLSTSLFRLVLSYLLIDYRPRLEWNHEAGMAFLHFGKFVFVNTLVTAVALQLDIFMVGKKLGMAELSFYNIGKTLGEVVFLFCLQIITQSYLPAACTVQTDLARVQRIYRRTVTFLLTVFAPVALVFAIFSGGIVEFLYDPRYNAASTSLFWISLAGITRIIGSCASATFFAIGRPGLETLSMTIGLTLVVILLPIGINVAGLLGAAISMALVLLLIAIVESFLLIRAVKFPVKIVLRPWGQALLLSAIAFGAFYCIEPLLTSDRYVNIPLALLATISLFAISALVYRFLEGPHPFRDEIPKNIS